MISLKRQSGFSLIEMAIVLTIIGVVSTGVLFGLGEFRSVQSVKEGGQKIDKLRVQLLLFGQANKFLPCPDTNFDGLEDRTATACSSDVGTAPYVDLGLQRDDVQDAWGNFIRYAVNREADDAALVCDKTRSASYFCNPKLELNDQNIEMNWFTFTETPPLDGIRGEGNYYVCNEIPNGCNPTSVTTLENLDSESASIVLVAYNQDGHQTLTNCGGQTGLNAENCDVDLFYQQGMMNSTDEGFFDDVVRSINGYEIKNAMLGKTIVWDEFPSINALTPTYEDFDITATDDQSQIETSGDDVVFVRRNVETALNLGSGDDYIAIGNDLESSATLNTGGGDDSVYIVGLARSAILLGAGDDAFVLATDLTHTLNADTGNDKVWIQGDVNSSATFLLGAGDDVVWLGDSESPYSGGLAADVNGGADYDILVLENMTKTEWEVDSIFQSYVVNFELVFFSDDGTGTREYVTLP